MSLSGKSGGSVLRGLDARGRREVIYLVLFPNVLLSLHPDYVMTHVLTPLGPDRTRVRCSWSFSPEDGARPGFDPSVRRRLLGHHQPPGLLGVRVGAAGPGL